MTTPQKALLLVGSPRGSRSTSASLGRYLLAQLKTKGFTCAEQWVYPAVMSREWTGKMLAKVDEADVLVLSSPLYIDSLPAMTTKALELIRDSRRLKDPKRLRFMAILNNGFPESDQNHTAIAICRKFAQESGMDWIGGIALGGGQFLDGKPLGEAGGLVRRLKTSLELAAGDVAEGRPLSKEAVELMAKPVMPGWMYRFMANRNWKKSSKRNGVLNRIRAKPYAD